MTAHVGILQTFAGLAAVVALAGLLVFVVLPAVGRRLLRDRSLNPLTARRLRRFRSMRAGWIAFVLIVSAFTASLFLELYCNERPLYVHQPGYTRMPAVADWGNFILPFGWFDATVPDVRGATVVMPLYPFSPDRQLLDLPGSPPHAWFQPGMPVLGTDAEGKDVLSQLLYGFRISLSFGVLVSVAGYVIGVLVGGAMGWYGGWTDLAVQRGIEIWSSIPFLYTIMIIASVIRPGYWTLALIMIAMQSWISITWYERGEFYREKARDYEQAARALGLSDWKIMVFHILPNALVPVVTFLPFDIVAFMSELVALDFLGFGMPPGTPSWGRLLEQGAANIVNHPHLVWVPVVAFAGTLLCVVFVGEAVREAYDPKPFARLR